ncbi:MAG: ATP-binding protein [Chthoniobacterales bacterium]
MVTSETGPKTASVVTVQDNGRGIDLDLRDKLFSPFCTAKARGMGLGCPS